MYEHHNKYWLAKKITKQTAVVQAPVTAGTSTTAKTNPTTRNSLPLSPRSPTPGTHKTIRGEKKKTHHSLISCRAIPACVIDASSFSKNSAPTAIVPCSSAFLA